MSEAGASSSLRLRFLGSAAWTGGSRAILIAFGIAVTAVLARLLDPADYGLLGMCTVVIGLLHQARDLGIGPALVQRRDINQAITAQAFTLALALGMGLCGLCLLLAQPVATFYGEPRVVPVLRWLAVGFVLTAFQVIPLALLRRELRLRGEAVARTIAAVTDAAVTITLAWRGMGVYALVAGSLANGAVFAAGLAWHRPWRPALRLGGGDGRSLLRFGGGVTLSSFLWYIYSNADFLIIGRVLGSAALGTYTMAWNLAKMPWDQLWISLSPMVLPLFSRTRDSSAGMAPAFLRLTRGLSMLAFPALAGLALVATEAVPLFLGPKWAGAVAPLRWLCLYGIFRSVAVLVSPLLMAGGKLGREVLFNAAAALLLPAAFAVAAPRGGVAAVAMVWTLLYPVLAMLLLFPPAMSLPGLRWDALARTLVRPATAAAAMATAVFSARLALPLTSAAALLMAQVAVGMVVYGVALRLLEGPAFTDRVRSLLGEIRAGARG